MKILPVNIFRHRDLSITNSKKDKNAVLSTPFTSNDTAHFGSILDMQIGELKEIFENEINPFIEKNKPMYIQIGKIGYDSQEKLKLAKNLNQQLFNKKFDLENNITIKKVEKTVEPYRKYLDNIKEFEQTSRFILNSKYYATPEMVRFIEKSRPKIYQGSTEFSKIKPVYDEYNQTKQNIDNDLNNIGLQSNPEFARKLKDLDNQNRTAVMLMLVSGYPDMLKLSGDAEKLFKDYKEHTQPVFKLMEQTERLTYDTRHFQEHSLSNRSELDKEIKDFIDANKNYKSENLTEEEINTVYNEFIIAADNTINSHAKKLETFVKDNPFKVSPRIIDKTLKAQQRTNKQLSILLQKAKEEFYKN